MGASKRARRKVEGQTVSLTKKAGLTRTRSSSSSLSRAHLHDCAVLLSTAAPPLESTALSPAAVRLWRECRGHKEGQKRKRLKDSAAAVALCYINEKKCPHRSPRFALFLLLLLRFALRFFEVGRYRTERPSDPHGHPAFPPDPVGLRSKSPSPRVTCLVDWIGYEETCLQGPEMSRIFQVPSGVDPFLREEISSRST